MATSALMQEFTRTLANMNMKWSHDQIISNGTRTMEIESIYQEWSLRLVELRKMERDIRTNWEVLTAIAAQEVSKMERKRYTTWQMLMVSDP